MSSSSDATSPAGLPRAVVRPRRRVSLAWIVPLLVVLIAAWLGYRAWIERGTLVQVRLDDGYGLREGDEVRFRGTVVGHVHRITMAEDLSGVIVTVSLAQNADRIAVGGSRFWVVRPVLGIDQVAGLDTVVGPRYLAVLPGDGVSQRRFIGLEHPPPVDSIEPGDLLIVLSADRRHGMQAGAPLYYRQMRVGTILSTGLTSDGGAVEARVHVQKAYAQLIRTGTRFWPVGGLSASVGLGGVSIEVDSLATLIHGGIALATPPGGEPVRNGHRFELRSTMDDEWADWVPLVTIGDELLPPGATRPAPLWATIGWRQGWLFKSDRSRQGWVLLTEDGLLGPRDLLLLDDAPGDAAPTLEVAGHAVPLDGAPFWENAHLAQRSVALAVATWHGPTGAPADVEDCIVVGDPAAPPLPLAAGRLTADGDVWRIDDASVFDSTWHGGAVVTRSEGRLVGMLIADKRGAFVALLGEQ